ncbi:MAG: hypothetical protein CMP49_03575 [Flavobacteriales bacterium]|nr:hypothetical protein [Flavobacteriales bacterium]
MVKLFYFIFSFFIFQISFSQDNKLFHNLDVPVSQYNFERDSNSFSVLQIPLLNFEFNIYSSPRLNSFLIKSNNNLILNLNLFANNINDYSHHIFDFSNSLAYYAVKKITILIHLV